MFLRYLFMSLVSLRPRGPVVVKIFSHLSKNFKHPIHDSSSISHSSVGRRLGSFVSGAAYHPQTETMAQIHGIRNITLGAIATTSILVRFWILVSEYVIEFRFQARWALSSNATLQAVGTSTGIHYFNDYKEYLKLLATGLHRKKKSVINIIREWDSWIFLNTDSSLVVVKVKSNKDNRVRRAMDSLDANSDDNADSDGGS